FRRGGGVDVAVPAERGGHRFVAGERGHHAEFDLRVVAGKEGESLARDDGLADLASEGGADRDVLEVRIGGGQAAGGGDELVELGVDAAGGRDDVTRQRVEVGALEFGGFAVFQ